MYAATQADAAWMAEALALAECARVHAHPNPAVGCVLVHGDDCVGRGWTQPPGQAHAEVEALRQAGPRARGATAFVTLEPCAHFGRTPPCADALIAAGVARVVYAIEDPNPQVAGQGGAMLRAAGIRVDSGLGVERARALNRGFLSRFERGRPFVSLKLACSLDGRTAMANGESQWITGSAARRDVHLRRAWSGAVGTSIDTVLADDPQLNVRLDDLSAAPTRVVFDTRLRTPATAALFKTPEPVVIVTASEADASHLPATVLRVPAKKGHVDLSAALEALASPGVAINEVLIECGPVLAGALLQAQLVDELVLYLAPKLMGDAARDLVHLPGVSALADAPELAISSVESVGPDWRVIATPTASDSSAAR